MSSLSSSKKKFTIYQLAFTALMAALVFVSTQFNIKIPLGMGVTSMISFGNIFCILSALLLGPIYGGLAAGIGSFFFDLLDPVFITSAPFTLVFKFIMAFVCGNCLQRRTHRRQPQTKPDRVYRRPSGLYCAPSGQNLYCQRLAGIRFSSQFNYGGLQRSALYYQCCYRHYCSSTLGRGTPPSVKKGPFFG